MAKLYLFAIGGTGARVLRSFTMLMASGQTTLKGYDVYPVILDYDEKNGDTKIATECIDNYEAIHKIVWKHTDFEKHDGYFKSALCKLGDLAQTQTFRMIYRPQGVNTYSDYIGYDTLGVDSINSSTLKKPIDTTVTRMLLDSLYNNDAISDDSELKLNMEVGFKGNPNIGSVVFHGLEDECPEFKSFLEHLTDTDKVVVIGSLFGGTGSSGIPEIIRKIRKKNTNLKISAVLVMPYFAPESQDGGTIRHEIFRSKTKAAINYYMQSGLIGVDGAGNMILNNGMIDSAFFIGDAELTKLKYCDGGEDQVNPANLVELVSAMSVLYFLDGFVNNGTGHNGCYKFGVKDYLVGADAVTKLFHDDLTDPFSVSVIKQLTAFTLALRYVVGRVLNPPTSWGKIDLAYYLLLGLDQPSEKMKDLLKLLTEFWKRHKAWLDELSNYGLPTGEGNSHSLTLFCTDPIDKNGKNIEILILKAANRQDKPKNKTISGSTIDSIANEAMRAFGNNGNLSVKDNEFLLMHGLYQATTDQKRVLNEIFR